MKITFSALLTKVESRVDKTCKAILTTQELGNDAGALMNLTGQQLNVLLVSADEGYTKEDIPDVPVIEEDAGLSPSRRQRNILYRIWEAKGKPDTFEQYYRMRLSKNEQLLKDELDKLTI